MVLIREMTAADYDSAYRLWESVPGMNLASLDNSAQGIAQVIQANPGLCFVAVEGEGEKVVGTALGATDGRKDICITLRSRKITKDIISRLN